jgi:YHS domain-containing protein
MKMSRTTLFSLASIALAGSGIAWAAVSLEGIKCPISGSAAKESKSVAFHEGKVYFCCEKCAAKFEEDKGKFAAKANHQLVATHQYMQTACPYSGGKLDDSTAIEVGGTKVAFCCKNCKGKAEGLKGDEQVEALFGAKAFEKGKFVKAEAKK